MKLEYEQPTGSRTAVQPANAYGRRSASAGSSRARHELVSVDVRPEHERRGGARNAMGRGDLAVAGELVVRRECRAGALILWLSGDLDRATSALLERELDGARADRRTRLLVDLSGLEYIDSGVVDTLVQAHRRARENGDQLSFTHGPRIVGPPPQLTDSVQPCSRSTPDSRAANDEAYYFALAMACADVDHQRHLADRPWGTLNRFPDQAAGASGAAPLPSAARPAPSGDRVLGNHNTGIPHGDAKQGPSGRVR
jgi:anti-anti-sigma factor